MTHRLEMPDNIIGVACGHGAPDRRCAGGPEALGIPAAATLTPRNDRAGALAVVAEVARRLARRVQQVCRNGQRPLVIGGDHSCAIGTWQGLRGALGQSPGLIWIDAHMDAHTAETSPSGCLHGMPLACLLGLGDPSLMGLSGVTPALDPRHVCLIGVRSHEAGEAALLQRLRVRVMMMEEVRRRGFASCLDEALQLVGHGTPGFGISLDLDAFDPREAPGVGTPVAGGLHAGEVLPALTALCTAPALRAFEIAEFNPASDIDGRTGALAHQLLSSLNCQHWPQAA